MLVPNVHQMCCALRLCSCPAELIGFSSIVNGCVHTGCMCAMPNIDLSTGDPEPFRENTQDIYFCLMLEYNAAIQHKTDHKG